MLLVDEMGCMDIGTGDYSGNVSAGVSRWGSGRLPLRSGSPACRGVSTLGDEHGGSPRRAVQTLALKIPGGRRGARAPFASTLTILPQNTTKHNDNLFMSALECG